MAHTEGEKELVLGNKQLISLFFVIVALCGVFFALGYMMGRPSGKQVAAIPDTSAASTSGGTVSPIPAPAQDSSQAEPPRETAPADVQPTPADTQPQPPKPTRRLRTMCRRPGISSLRPRPPTKRVQPTCRSGPSPHATPQISSKPSRNRTSPRCWPRARSRICFASSSGPIIRHADVADAKARLKALGFANAFVQK